MDVELSENAVEQLTKIVATKVYDAVMQELAEAGVVELEEEDPDAVEPADWDITEEDDEATDEMKGTAGFGKKLCPYAVCPLQGPIQISPYICPDQTSIDPIYTPTVSDDSTISKKWISEEDITQSPVEYGSSVVINEINYWKFMNGEI